MDGGSPDASTDANDDGGIAVGLVQLGTSAGDYGNGIALDGTGHRFVTGATYGGWGTSSGAGQADFFLAKVDAQNDVTWVRQFGTMAAEGGRAVTTDATGNAYAAGTAYGSLPGFDNPMPGNGEAFVAKYDAAGSRTWLSVWETTADDYVYAVAVDASNRAYVAGSSDQDLFLVQFEADGQVGWSDVWGTSDYDEVIGVTMGPGGDVYVVGMVSGSVDGKAFAGEADVFVSRYSASGNRISTRLFGTADYDVALGIAHDATTDTLIVTGLTWGSLQGQPHAGEGDVFVMRLDGSLAPVWTRQFGTTGFDQGNYVAVDAQGTIFVTGETDGVFGPGGGGDKDAFVARLSGNGTVDWVRQWGSDQEDWGNAIAARDGRAFVTGTTLGTMGATTQGGIDVFLLTVE